MFKKNKPEIIQPELALDPKEKSDKPKTPKKSKKPAYEGSRFGSLILLILTVLVSLAFYFSGS